MAPWKHRTLTGAVPKIASSYLGGQKSLDSCPLPSKDQQKSDIKIIKQTYSTCKTCKNNKQILRMFFGLPDTDRVPPVGGIEGRDGAIEHGLTVITFGAGTPWRHAASTTVDLLGHVYNCDVGIQPPGIKSNLKGNLKQCNHPSGKRNWILRRVELTELQQIISMWHCKSHLQERSLKRL